MSVGPDGRSTMSAKPGISPYGPEATEALKSDLLLRIGLTSCASLPQCLLLTGH
jgi:hypothetical protein